MGGFNQLGVSVSSLSSDPHWSIRAPMDYMSSKAAYNWSSSHSTLCKLGWIRWCDRKLWQWHHIFQRRTADVYTILSWLQGSWMNAAVIADNWTFLIGVGIEYMQLHRAPKMKTITKKSIIGKNEGGTFEFFLLFSWKCGRTESLSFLCRVYFLFVLDKGIVLSKCLGDKVVVFWD